MLCSVSESQQKLIADSWGCCLLGLSCWPMVCSSAAWQSHAASQSPAQNSAKTHEALKACRWSENADCLGSSCALQDGAFLKNKGLQDHFNGVRPAYHFAVMMLGQDVKVCHSIYFIYVIECSDLLDGCIQALGEMLDVFGHHHLDLISTTMAELGNDIIQASCMLSATWNAVLSLDWLRAGCIYAYVSVRNSVDRFGFVTCF